MEIKTINTGDYEQTIDIYTGAFANDPLFLFAIPDLTERKRLTRIMYEFVVLELVPLMEMSIKGIYNNDKLIGVCTYTIPESKTTWTDKLDKAVLIMRNKAKNINIRLIGEYSMASSKFRPKQPHFYLNELAIPPEEQGKGYCGLLIKNIESECKAHKSAVGIGLDTPNRENVKLYSHLGYEVTNKFKFYELTGYVMYKRLK